MSHAANISILSEATGLQGSLGALYMGTGGAALQSDSECRVAVCVSVLLDP